MKIEIQNTESITKIFTITHYEIINITITPNLKAIIELLFFCTNGSIYRKNYTLQDKEYTDWLDDSYLDTFIKNNLAKIFID